jgi:hypothetical protein
MKKLRVTIHVKPKTDVIIPSIPPVLPFVIIPLTIFDSPAPFLTLLLNP